MKNNLANNLIKSHIKVAFVAKLITAIFSLLLLPLKIFAGILSLVTNTNKKI